MLIFWLLFFAPLLGLALGGLRKKSEVNGALWVLIFIVFANLIGFRHEVGGDWFNYEAHFSNVSHMVFAEAVDHGDPGYYALNWLIAQLGGGVYWANFACACIVMAGVVVFARSQPAPWLALLVAVPYLIVVVAMGYTRQSVALGLALLGLTALGQQKTKNFVFWVILGALFHKSAVLLLPIAALAASKRRLWTFLWVSVSAGAAASLLVLESSEALWSNYVEAQMQSEGGAIRVTMNALPAALFLLFQNKMGLSRAEKSLWRWLSIFALACIPLISLASTAVDRVALYFIPVQMFVFSHLHLVVAQSARSLIISFVVIYYATVQFVWLNYANHAQYWVPYQFMPL